MAGLRKYSGLQPYIVEYHGDHPGTKSGERRQRSLNEPLATQDTSNRFGLVQPFLTKLYGGLDDACSIDEPMGTITANFEHYGLAEPYLVNVAHSSAGIDERTYPLDEPLHTITSKGQFGIVHPYLTKYYGTGGAVSVDEPLDTITTIDRFGVSEPQLVETSHAAHLLKALKDPNPLYRPQIVEIDGVTYLVDILYRMLLPSELAAAMSFPADYFFSGTQGDQVKQIGNSVPVKLAKALCKSILGVESYGPPVLHHQRTAPSLPNQQAV
jgi:DNA (cytosine-5)-methyltransferase 1